MRVAFIIDAFPVISQTFVIDQVAGLMDKGVDVQVFSFKKGGLDDIAENFKKYEMSGITHYMNMPKNKFSRIIKIVPKVLKLLKSNPSVLFKALNVKKFGKNALSLKTVYLADFFKDKEFDLAHCHFGPVANDFLIAKEILTLKQKLITTFYGYDASRIFKTEGEHYYDKLNKECSMFFAMSADMKERLVSKGFDPGKIKVHPPGIDLSRYQFKERLIEDKINILSIGRLVEKKGFDDLLRALNVVKQKTTKPVACTIVGDGPLKSKLRDMASSLDLDKVVKFRGQMRMEEINDLLPSMHLYVQPSKTDSIGNME